MEEMKGGYEKRRLKEDVNGGCKQEKGAENYNLLVLQPLFLSKLDRLPYHHLVVVSDEIKYPYIYSFMLIICYAQL